MDTLKRIFKNIQWLLNHPPIGTNSDPSLFRPCDYCEDDIRMRTNYVGVLTICAKCMKKAFDKVLKKRKK